MKPLVSIIIPTYNMGQFIAEAIESALNQTFKDFEIIIGDNLSTDNTIEIVEKFKDKRIKLIKNPVNMGAIANFNNLIHKSSGKYVKFLEADDKLDNKCLEKILEIFDQYSSVEMVCTGKFFINEDSKLIGNFAVKKDYNILPPYNSLRILKYGNEFGTPSDVMVKKEVFDELGVFDDFYDRYLNDWDLWIRIALCKPIYFTSYKSCYVRRHDLQMGKVGVINNLDIIVNAKMYSKIFKNNFFIKNIHGTEMLTYYSYRTFRKSFINKSFKEMINFLKILKIHFDYFGILFFLMVPLNLTLIIIIKSLRRYVFNN
jgi:glycosyltransferase involved in cell wall biosynthesis